MNIKTEILNQFIAPNGSNRELIEEKIQMVNKQLMDFLTNAEQLPSNPELKIKSSEYFKIPESINNEKRITSNLQELYNLSMNAANPKYIGHMDSMPTMWSVLGDYIASAINNNLLSLEMSPLLTQMEYSLTKQFSTLFGLPDSAGGVMLSGGTLSNLQALLIARNTKLNIKNGNVFALKKEPVIFTSEHSHASIQKIGMMIGIGVSNVIKIKTDENSRIDVSDLKVKIKEQKELGKIPFAIVATAGTTVTGNIDPLSEIAKIATKNNLWFHVDAIYGGAIIFSAKHKHLINGIERADSIAFNPQKWLYVAKTCSMVLFRTFDNMVENFRISAPYMKEQSNCINLGEINVQGTKYAEVLKLWLSLLSLGKDGYAELIDVSMFRTNKFEREIRKRTYLKFVSQPELNIICFRAEAKNKTNEELDNWNKDLQDYLVNETSFFLSLPRYKGGLWLRTVLLNPFLTTKHIDELFNHIDRFKNEH